MHTLIKGATSVVGIIGYPVEHSRSPQMQNAAFEASCLDYVYIPFSVCPASLGKAVDGLCALGVKGFNVTIPHKTAIIPFLDVLDESAEAAGAVNTVHNVDGILKGYNTDGDGFVRSLADDLEFSPANSSVVIIGAGGAARGAVDALCRAGASSIVIINRTAEKAEAIQMLMCSRCHTTEIITSGYDDNLSEFLSAADLVVNTTSLGMYGEDIPYFDVAYLSSGAKIYDMVYSCITPLLKKSAERRLTNAGGIGMLAAQGELAFKVWTGIMPPPGLMKRVLLKA